MAKQILANPSTYQFLQVLCGFFSARIKSIREHLDLHQNQRIIDIGCGPGHIISHLPNGIVYDGFDVDQTYIDFANKRFGNKGSFHCRIFDEKAAADFGPADVVLMNGVLHHMDDDAVRLTTASILKVLRPGGVMFALDPVYFAGQGAFDKWFIDHDRGKFVRTEAGYRTLLAETFGRSEFHVRGQLARIPYTLIISKCTKDL